MLECVNACLTRAHFEFLNIYFGVLAHLGNASLCVFAILWKREKASGVILGLSVQDQYKQYRVNAQ